MSTVEKGSGGYSVSRIGRQSLIYGGGIVVAKLAALAMMPVYFAALSPADYGVIAIVEIAFDMLSIVAGSRLATGIFRFYHKASDSDQRLRVLSTAILLIASLYGVVGTLAFLNAPALAGLAFGAAEGYTHLMRLAAVTFIMQGVMLVPMSHYRLRDEARLYVGADIAKLCMQVGLNIVFLVFMKLGVTGVLLANLIATTLTGSAVAVRMLRITGVSFDSGAARDLIRFGAPMILNQVATFFVTFADRFVLQRVTNESEVGLYSLAYYFGVMTVTLGYTPYQMIWDPVRYEVSGSQHRDQALSRGFRHMNVLLLSVAVALVLFTGDVISIMGGEAKFGGAAPLVPMIVVAHIFLSWAAVQDIGILVTERTRYIALANWTAAAVSVVGFVIVIPHLGAKGAAITCLASFFTRWLMIYSFSQRLFPVAYEWRPVRFAVAAAVGVIIIASFLPTLALVTSLTIHAALGMGFLLILWHTGILDEDERRTALHALRNPARIRTLLRGSGPV